MQLFYNSATEAAPVVIDGVPPVDQSAEVATLTQQLTAANATITEMQAAIDGVKQRAQARKDADAAKVEGQDDLDALSGF